MNQSTLSSEQNGEWLTVSEAAARLRVSERAIQRRCKAGRLSAQLKATPTGQQWQIDGSMLANEPEAATQSDDTNDTWSADSRDRDDTQAATATTETTAQTTPTTQETTGTTPEAPTAATQTTLGAATPTTGTTASGDAVLVEELRDQVKFLRLQVEAANRTAAEAQAALREVLKMSNRALTEGAQSTFGPTTDDTAQSRREAQERAESTSMSKVTPEPTRGPQTEPERPQTTPKYFERKRGFRSWILKMLKN